MQALRDLFRAIEYSIPNIGIMDVIDMLVIAFVIYKLIRTIRGTSASYVVKAVVFLLIATGLTSLLQLNAVNFLLTRVLELGAVALLIVFQPELRRILEHLGSRRFKGLLGSRDDRTDLETAIEETVNACEILSQEKIGALIVFERGTPLSDQLKTGVILDAKLTTQLLRSVFYPKTALHDGAVIVRQARLAAAGCLLPLTENSHLSSDLGTRHRAGIGMSEVSDALVIIVSEETGAISVAVGGMLKRHLAPRMLEKLLKNELLNETDLQDDTLLGKLKRILKMGESRHAEK
ncbi:MAG: diadenylate cyclase CdaA [Oscillospiraceae bacterium]|nr:diadenylate cyclase CdaA [Oscillospiraceae bacterium]